MKHVAYRCFVACENPWRFCLTFNTCVRRKLFWISDLKVVLCVFGRGEEVEMSPLSNPESVEGIPLSRRFEGCCALVLPARGCKGCMPKTVAICGKAEFSMIVGQLSGSKPSPLLCQSNHQIIIFNFFMSPNF